jgi:crossover junction endodeoxyribonuclease RuvC
MVLRICILYTRMHNYTTILLQLEWIFLKILGIDPGYAITGYGLIEVIGNKYCALDYGSIQTSAGTPLSSRLLILSRSLQELLETHQPDAVAVEELFFSKNTKTALIVGHARGVILLEIARCGLPVHEYTPVSIKQTVTGYGRADKIQVTSMVCRLLALKVAPKPDDVADALAVALCHAQHRVIVATKQQYQIR